MVCHARSTMVICVGSSTPLAVLRTAARPVDVLDVAVASAPARTSKAALRIYAEFAGAVVSEGMVASDHAFRDGVWMCTGIGRRGDTMSA